MCGRFTLRHPAKTLEQAFGVAVSDEMLERFNVAPAQEVAVIRADPINICRELAFLKWGLVPSWADDPSIGNRMINARAETVATKPAFGHAFRNRRCLIVADGFFEWQKGGARKQPFYISLASDQPFAFAGLWERWTKGPEPLESCTIITCPPNELVAQFHNRMPVIVPPEYYDFWLGLDAGDPEQLESLLRPFPAELMTAHLVSTLVNSPANDVQQCLMPIQ